MDTHPRLEMITAMTKAEYDRLQSRLSAMLNPGRLRYKGITGKREEGYQTAILAVKSMLKDEYTHQKGGQS